MYVKTELRVYQVIQEYTDFYVVKDGNVNPALPKSFVLSESDNLSELCDEFVAVDNNKWSPNYLIPFDEIADEIKRNGSRFKYFGAIWTSKGLIYVAKLNQKGVLELL